VYRFCLFRFLVRFPFPFVFVFVCLLEVRAPLWRRTVPWFTVRSSLIRHAMNNKEKKTNESTCTADVVLAEFLLTKKQKDGVFDG